MRFSDERSTIVNPLGESRDALIAAHALNGHTATPRILSPWVGGNRGPQSKLRVGVSPLDLFRPTSNRKSRRK